MNRALAIIVGLTLFVVLPQAEGRENPFVSKQAPAKEIRLPAFASRLMGQVMLWQHELNTKLTEQVRRIKDEKSWQVFWPLMLACFLYGVVHAAGPGHGKVVVFSYLLSRRSNIRQGILLGNLISLFHAVSGMAIVLVLYFVIKTVYLASFEAISRQVGIISYSLVLLIGLGLLVHTLFTIRRSPSSPTENVTSSGIMQNKSVLPLAVAVGMVPCPGVVIVMLFALSFNLLALGLAMSLIMALGMAATISLAGVLTILGKEGLLRGLSRKERTQHVIRKSLSILGSLLIIAFGAMLLSTVL